MLRTPFQDDEFPVLCRSRHHGAVAAGRSLTETGGIAKLPLPDEQPVAVNALRNKRAAILGDLALRQAEIYNALREHGTVSANDLAEAAAQAKEVAETDRQTRREFVNRFHNMLHHMRRRGKLEKIGHGPGVRWKLAAKDGDLI